MWTKSRNGIRKADHSASRRCTRYATRMLRGATRPNYLSIACRALNKALRIRARLAREDPHLFGPHSRQYFLDTLEMEKREKEIEATLQAVYGPPKPGEPVRVSTLWTDRYHVPEKPKLRRMFFKWFHEKYPPL